MDEQLGQLGNYFLFFFCLHELERSLVTGFSLRFADVPSTSKVLVLVYRMPFMYMFVPVGGKTEEEAVEKKKYYH